MTPRPPRRPNILQAAAVSLLLLGVMWIEEISDATVFRGGLDQFGIVPRSEEGLRGILFAPFLHVGFAHLMANSGPFLVLAFVTLLRSLRRFVVVTAVVMLVGGLGVWLFAAPGTVTLGASLLIFGYLGYLLANGLYERTPLAMVTAAVVLLLYGGALWGVLPLRPDVSWQAHLFGFVGGVLAARMTARRPLRRPLDAPPPRPPFDSAGPDRL